MHDLTITLSPHDVDSSFSFLCVCVCVFHSPCLSVCLSVCLFVVLSVYLSAVWRGMRNRELEGSTERSNWSKKRERKRGRENDFLSKLVVNTHTLAYTNTQKHTHKQRLHVPNDRGTRVQRTGLQSCSLVHHATHRVP